MHLQVGVAAPFIKVSTQIEIQGNTRQTFDPSLRSMSQNLVKIDSNAVTCYTCVNVSDNIICNKGGLLPHAAHRGLTGPERAGQQEVRCGVRVRPCRAGLPAHRHPNAFFAA
ncbi:hypothetical protein FOCC_FOCC002051 [Frankliniella occidentalis]|nr:hypothetical protein FOCC_FOCC002051 [Frankliniella occidentalis]